MTTINWYKKNLADILPPKGASNLNVSIPDVIDSDGNPIYFTDPKRITSQVTTVDVGDSPNSNTGDPLRTAFVKLDNIAEAIYRNDVNKDYRLKSLEQFGRFMGILDYSQLPLPPLSTIKDPTVQPNAHLYPQNGDFVIVKNRLSTVSDNQGTARELFIGKYPFISIQSISAITNEAYTYSVSEYALLVWNDQLKTIPGYWQGQWQVLNQLSLEDFDFNFDEALTRLFAGDAQWSATGNASGLSQDALYQAFNNQSVAVMQSKRLLSRNVADALIELTAKANINTLDAGYYG